MAAQVLIAETIRGMKLAMRRRPDDSDSDSSIHQHTNRGNKLKRKAAFVREGRLDNTGGRSYRRKINHAGYQRYIIHTNPPKFDDDGDLVEEEDDEEGNASPEEDNPFGETKLEYLLAPLTSAAELADHPSLSHPYTSKSLTEMVENAQEMLHNEREALWQMKQLLQRFRGDEMWIPLEKIETDQDVFLMDNDGVDGLHDMMSRADTNSTIAGPVAKENGAVHDLIDIVAHAGSEDGVQTMDMLVGQKQGLKTEQLISTHGTTGDGVAPEHDNGELEGHNELRDSGAHLENEKTVNTDGLDVSSADAMDTDDIRKSVEADSNAGQPQHRMTTRAKARTPPYQSQDGSPSMSPAPSTILSVNNYFLPPFAALPDRDFGLPANEAEDTRRLLLLYVQKQEEIVRGAEGLLEGLLRAERMRKQVWAWCKAERHVGEMSDGEDWYDKEEWGLDKPLIKGKDEEDVEEEGGRKGRRRREGKKVVGQ